RCGLVVVSGTLAATTRKNIIRAASEQALPAIYPNRLYVRDGGLLSFGPHVHILYRAAGSRVREYLQTGRFSPGLDTLQTDDTTAVFEHGVNVATAEALGNVVDQHAIK